MNDERPPPTLTYAEMEAQWMQDPAFRAEYERMGTQAPAVARLENTLITGSPSPSLNTLRKYAAALGKRLEVRLT
jgi:hypothetical protein